MLGVRLLEGASFAGGAHHQREGCTAQLHVLLARCSPPVRHRPPSRRDPLTEPAEALLAEAVAGRRRLLGDQHPHTLLSIDRLGWLHHRRSEHASARALLQEALDGRRHTLGDSHEDTLDSIINLGMTYVHMGEFAQVGRHAAPSLSIVRSPPRWYLH
jgi:hypothetical protein